MAKMKYNYGKNKKSILWSLMLIFCLTFIGMWMVYAGGAENNGGSGSGSGGGSSSSTTTNYNIVRFGVRASFVDKEGNQIGHFIDFWPVDPMVRTQFQSAKIRVANVNGNYGAIRQKVTGSINFWDTSSTAAEFSSFCGGEMKNCTIFGNGGLWMYGMGSLFQQPSSVQNIANEIVSYYNNPATLQGTKDALNIYLREMGTNENIDDLIQAYNDNYDLANPDKFIKDSIEDRFIQLEPVISARVQISGSAYWFYGSVTELGFHASEAGSIPDALVRAYSSGVYIKKDTKTNNFSTEGSVATSAAELVDISRGFGVVQIWLKDLVNVNVDCTEELMDYIANKYTVGTQTYHDKIALVKNGKFSEKVQISPEVVKSYEVNRPQAYNLLDKDVYTDTTLNPSGKAACKNIIKDPPIICSPDPDINIDDCTTGNTYFKDNTNPDNWLVCKVAYTKNNIKYSSDNTGHEAVETTNGGIVGNAEYCELFCYEEVETHFQTKVVDVKAGQTFVWGDADGTFGTVSIKKHCSNQAYKKGQQGYRFEEWEDDFRTNQKQQVDNYLDWQFNEWANGTINIRASGTCCIGSCGTSKNPRCCSRPTRYVGTKSSYSRNHTDAWLPSVNGSTDGAYSASGCSYSEVYNALYVSTGGYSSAYTVAKNNEQPLLVKIRQCTNNIKYVYETAVTFVFKEPTNRAYGANDRAFGDDNGWNWNLDIDPDNEDGYNKDNVNLSSCTRKRVYSYNCTGSGTGATCTPITEWVLDCKQVTWDITGEYTYNYPMDEFQWFSDKRDSTLVNKKNKPNGEEAYFYSIGFGLPTAFSLTSGKYEMAVVVGNLGDNAVIMGAQKYNTENGHFAPITNIVTSVDINKETISVEEAYGFEYKCTYDVVNEIFGYDCVYSGEVLTANSPEYCDPTNNNESNGELNIVDVAYRLVDLLGGSDSINKAFPGIDGTGREIGDNWDKLGINKIKEILRNDIYESLAMYEIMLDVNAIQYIRSSNKKYFEYGKDPYTSYTDENNNQKVYCKSKGTNNEFKYCASEFLTELQTTSSLNYNLRGTCLPQMGTEARAQDVLDNGCYTTYTYPKIDWKR